MNLENLEQKNTEKKVAQELIKIGAIKFVPDNPITFRSGIKSPVYVDNRRLSYNPKSWQVVIEGFRYLIKEENINFDVLAGVESGGVPHGCVLAYSTEKPFVFVRKSAKDHGTRKLVEGGDVKNKSVLVVEDLVTTGHSSLHAISSLQGEGALVSDCLVIVSYGFPQAEKAFMDASELSNVSKKQFRKACLFTVY